MTALFKKQTVLVLDLDDTLYYEKDYVISGIKFVASLIKTAKGFEVEQELLELYYYDDKFDFLEFCCQLSGLPSSSKISLLWAYRNHYPNISLSNSVSHWVSKCLKEYKAVVILSDGRSITQNLKIKALGLSLLPAYISEDWGEEKPDSERFLAIERDFRSENYIYIGDNPRKDFIAPNKLNWITIGLTHKKKFTHLKVEKIYPKCAPKYWLDGIDQTDLVLKKHLGEA